MSVGVVHATPGMEAEQILTRSDAAMYTAKIRGTNRVEVFDPERLAQPAPLPRSRSARNRSN